MTELTHHHFIRSRLPAWLLNANPAEQAKLQEAALSLAEAGHRFNQAINVIPSMRDFALLRLQPDMDRLFGRQIDLERSSLVRRFRDDCVTYPLPGRPSTLECTPHPSETRSLLTLALHNFPSADTQAQAFATGSHIELYPASASASASAGATSPQLHDFARLCRELDIGEHYKRQLQRHLQELPRDAAPLPSLAADYIDYRRALLRQDAQQARMQGLLDAEGERILAAFGVQLDASNPVTPLPTAVASGLEASDRWQTDERVILQGVCVFWADRQTAQRVIPVVVHIPGDPVSPLKQYASSADFQADLFKRLSDLRYRVFFINLLPHGDRDWGDRTLVRLLRQKEQKLVTDSELRGGVWHGLYNQWRGVVLTNASVLARSVADIDRDVLVRNIETWLRVGLQLFIYETMLLPGVAPLAVAGAVVGMTQFTLDVYEGIHDLNLGEKQEAIQHLFSAALTVATVAVGGFASNRLLGEMAPVATADGSERLWHGRTEGFAAKRLPPADVTPDPYGVWRAGDDAWVKIEERFYEVVGQERTLRIKPPPGYRGVEPALEWSRPTGWRWAHRDFLGMQGVRLLREIDPQLRVLRDASLNDAQRLTGISDDRLRYLAVNGEPLPGQLPYMARRLEARAQVRDAVTHLRANQPVPVVPRGVAQLLTELRGWPARRAFRFTGEGGPFASTGTGTELLLEESAFGTGQWQERLLAQLDASEKRALLGDETPWETPSITHRRLANLLADRLEANAHRVVDNFANLAAQHPNAAILLRDFPTLPGPVVDELLSAVTAEELRSLIAGRVPASLAQRAVEALRELRVARALEALQAGVAGNDRDRLVMSLLAPELQGQPVRVQLLLDEGFADGPLEAGETGPLKTIRRSGGRYEPFDETDNELSPPTSLEDALLRALPDPVRDALDLHIWQQDVLRSRLLENALENREQLRSALGMRPSQTPDVRFPERVGEHLGYPMSGRGPAFWRRNTPDARLQALYPHRDVSTQVLTELRGRIASTGKTLDQLITEKETEWKVLDDSLAAWEHDPNKHHVLEDNNPQMRVATRRDVGSALRKSWRREMTATVSWDPVRVPSLNVASARVVELPTITADFSHVETLSLRDMALSGDPSDFLRRFPNLRYLWLEENRLTRVPAALAEMPQLRKLSLAENPLISFEPEQFQAIGNLSQLELLELTGCRLPLDEDSGAFLTGLSELRNLRLGGNKITELPSLTGLPRLVELDLSQARMEMVPQAVIDLIQRQPLGMLDLNLSGNRIKDVTPLLPALTRADLNRRDLNVKLDDNPLPVEQIKSVRDAGYSFAYTRDQWLSGRTVLQQAFEKLRQDPLAADFLNYLSDEVRRAPLYAGVPQIRGACVAKSFFQLDSSLEQLRPAIPDLDQRFIAFRKRIYSRLGDRRPPTLDELEEHTILFDHWCRTLASPQTPAFASFIERHYEIWIRELNINNQGDPSRIRLDATQEGFVQRLVSAQNEFDPAHFPAFGELYWYPYLKDMSPRWVAFQARWDVLSEALTDAFDEAVDTSTWPQVLLDNLVTPSNELPRPPQPLESVADVAWGGTVELTEDQLRRAAQIFRSVKASEALREAAQATEELVQPWWPLRSLGPIG